MESQEIYRDRVSEVFLQIPVEPQTGIVSYTIVDTEGVERWTGSATNVASPTVGDENNPEQLWTASFDFPYLLAEFDEEFEVRWEFYVNDVAVSRTTRVVVVTPYVRPSDLDHPSEFDADVELIVRKVIENMTGMTFGYSKKTYEVYGHGDTSLVLPNRLIELDRIYYADYEFDQGLIVTGDGWQIENDPYEYISGSEPQGGSDHGPVIVPPRNAPGARYRFAEDRKFLVSGYWGYAYVPENVKKAALLLYDDYSCKDAAWRNKYVEQFRYADSSMKFHDAAWQSTGNATADKLLSEYAHLGIMVI